MRRRGPEGEEEGSRSGTDIPHPPSLLPRIFVFFFGTIASFPNFKEENPGVGFLISCRSDVPSVVRPGRRVGEGPAWHPGHRSSLKVGTKANLLEGFDLLPRGKPHGSFVADGGRSSALRCVSTKPSSAAWPLACSSAEIGPGLAVENSVEANNAIYRWPVIRAPGGPWG